MRRRLAVAAVASLVPAVARLSGAVLLLLAAHQASAQDAASCLECHALPEQELSFRNGDTRSITLDPKAWGASAHGEAGLDCNACHTEHGEYPHAEIKDAGSREYAVARTGACVNCHEDQVKKFADGVHFAMLQAGNHEGGRLHRLPRPARGETAHRPGAGDAPARGARWPSRARVRGATRRSSSSTRRARTARRCSAKANPDVPTCIDCHGVHRISDPRTARFRVELPEDLCRLPHRRREDGALRALHRRAQDLRGRLPRLDGHPLPEDAARPGDEQAGLLRLPRRPRHPAHRRSREGDPRPRPTCCAPASSATPTPPPTSRTPG